MFVDFDRFLSIWVRFLLVFNLTAKLAPGMLGSKMGMKRVAVRALKVLTISNSTVFQDEAIREDGRSPSK